MAIYAWADLHGRMDIFQVGLEYLNPEDKVYFLGDAADRGLDGWKIIKAIINDNRFTYLKGNHEDLLVKAIGKITQEDYIEGNIAWDSDINLWFLNGGEPTYTAIFNDKSIPIQEIIDIINKLKTLPFCAVYHNAKGQNVILSHSGYDGIDYGNEEKFIWDRHHLMFYDTWDGEPNEVIVHGHTPIELMINDQEKNALWYKDIFPKPWKGIGAYWYAKNHKCNIDTGAVWNHNSTLLNLDTWEEIIINLN